MNYIAITSILAGVFFGAAILALYIHVKQQKDDTRS